MTDSEEIYDSIFESHVQSIGKINQSNVMKDTKKEAAQPNIQK